MDCICAVEIESGSECAGNIGRKAEHIYTSIVLSGSVRVETGKRESRLVAVPIAIPVAIPTTIAIAVITAAISVLGIVRIVGTVGDRTAIDRVGDFTECIAHLWSERDQSADDHNRDQSEDERILYQSLTGLH